MESKFIVDFADDLIFEQSVNCTLIKFQHTKKKRLNKKKPEEVVVKNNLVKWSIVQAEIDFFIDLFSD